MRGKEEVGLAYFMRWEVSICALIVVTPAVIAAAVIRKTMESRRRLRAACLWVPCWRGLHPVWLLAYRALMFLVMCAVLISQAVRHEGVYTFFFYTQWTFALVAIYFAVGTLVSAQNCLSYSREVPSVTEERNNFLEESGHSMREIQTCNSISNNSIKVCDREEKADFLGHSLQIIYQTSAGAVLLTDIVFWCLLVPFLMDDRFKLNVLMGLMHSLNLVSLLFDTALNSMAFPLFGMAYFVLWSCAFVIFQWIVHACGVSWWPYPFLELATPWAPLWYFGIALVHIPCYGFYTLVVKLKTSLLQKFFTHAYVMMY